MSNRDYTGWTSVTLGDICHPKDGLQTGPFGSQLHARDYTEKGIPVIMPKDIIKGRISDATIARISDLKSEELKRHRCKVGDIIFGRRGDIGRCGLITEREEGWLCGTGCLRVRPLRGTVPQFLIQVFSLPQVTTWLLANAVGQTMLNLNTGILSDLPLELPPAEERHVIADILGTWDNQIENTEKLITAKTKRKRGLMQHLLTGKKRFREFANRGWKRIKISDFTSFKPRVRPKPEKPFTALGIRSHGKGTFLKPAFDPSKIEMTELFEVKENDLIVNITFAWEGAIAIVGPIDDGALVSHRFPTYEFKTDIAIPEFFRYVIGQKWFVDRLGLVSPGGAGRNRVLNKRDFGKIEVLMPSVEEQGHIASVLNACDKEIELLKKQLDALKRQKRGLMQKLLTGQIRVKVGDETNEELISA